MKFQITTKLRPIKTTLPLTIAVLLASLLATTGQASVRESSNGSVRLLNEGISSFSTSASSTNFELIASSSSYTNQLRSSSSLAMRNGYVGTIYEVDSLQVAPSGPNVDEGTTVSFTAVATLDDGTTLTLPASRVAWETPAAPLGPIDSTTGESTASPVASDTQVDVSGLFLKVGTVQLTVINSDPDNFPNFSGDGIDDAWQVQYGINSAGFIPTLDDDKDGIELILEAFLNLDPGTADVSDLPEGGQIELNNETFLTFSFRRHKRMDLSFAVEKSTTLSAGSFFEVGLVELDDSPAPIDADTDLHTFRSTTPITSADAEFIRLSVEESAP